MQNVDIFNVTFKISMVDLSRGAAVQNVDIFNVAFQLLTGIQNDQARQLGPEPHITTGTRELLSH